MTVQPELAVVICCYNSEKIIEETLRALAAQEDIGSVWEVVLVDNNCNDQTTTVAKATWEDSGSPAPLKIIAEPTVGHAAARKCGVYATDAPLIVFCDDDNQFASDYLAIAQSFMDRNESVAVLGGWGTAITDGEFPDWFDRFYRPYAVGPQRPEEGLTESYLYGAGIVFRREDLLKFYEAGFSHLLSGRTRGKTTSGDDVEMQEWLEIFNCGDRYYLPSLKFEHYLLPERLTWKHLKKLIKGFARSSPVLHLYKEIRRSQTLRSRSYYWIKFLLKYIVITFLGFRKSLKGTVIFVGGGFTSVTWLLTNRSTFCRAVDEINEMHRHAREISLSEKTSAEKTTLESQQD